MLIMLLKGIAIGLISGTLPITEGLGLVCGVFTGTYCWWSGLTAATAFFKRKSRVKDLERMNRIFGFIMIVFAALILIRMCG